MKQALATVITNSEVMPGTYLIWLESPQIAAEAKPGQFVMVSCGEDTLLRRPLSVHQVDGGKIAMLFAIVGKGTRWLSQRQIGDTIDIFGPLGNGFSVYPASRNLLLVAGGTGIAALYFLNQKAIEGRCSVTLLNGTANKHQYTQYYLPAQTTLVSATADGSLGRKGMVTDLLPNFINWSDQIFACGPLSMYRDMAQRKRQLGLQGKPVQVSLEVVMGCGHGVCYGCTIRTKKGLKQVCKDGPVFDLDDIIWEEMES